MDKEKRYVIEVSENKNKRNTGNKMILRETYTNKISCLSAIINKAHSFGRLIDPDNYVVHELTKGPTLNETIGYALYTYNNDENYKDLGVLLFIAKEINE